MKTTTNALKALSCSLTGHHFVVSHVVNDRVQEYCCTNCKKQVTTDIYGNLQPLSPNYERINKALNDLAVKKNRRSTVAA